MKRLLLFSFVFIAVSLVWAVIWPVSFEYAVNGFGLWFNGSVNRGIEFVVQNAPVYAPVQGEVVFECTEETLFGGFPVPQGSMLVCKNQGDILTIYSGILPSKLLEQHPVFEEHTMLGTTRDTADAHMYTYIFDLKNTVYLHPHHVYPEIKENILPQVRTALLMQDTIEVSLSTVKSIKQGNWYIKLRAVDLITQNYVDGIKTVTCLLDGAEKQSVVLDTISIKNGKLYYQVNKAWSNNVLDDEGFLILGPIYITKGKSIISLVLEDFYGNKKSYSWPVIVE